MSRTDTLSPTPPRDLSHHFSRVARNREPSQIKRFYKYFTIPGIGNLAGGLPAPSNFPYDTLEARAAQPDRFEPTPNRPVDPGHGSNKKAPSSSPETHVVVPHDQPDRDPLHKIDLNTALQYGTAQGYPPLYTFLKDFALNTLHRNIPYAGGADIILTNGNTDGFYKTMELFNNSWDEDRDWQREREGLLCEEFVYMMPATAARPRGMNIVPVAIDREGMVAQGPGGLADVLDNWDRSKGKIPHLMYTVTMGQNPTSGVLSVTRRKEIYAICQKYDIIIVEDDPYWYLQYPSATELSIQHKGRPVSENIVQEQAALDSGHNSSGYDFIDSLVPSYLSIDTDGRVVRLDTFSKTVAPGCRLGWVTAQPAIIEKLLRSTECSTQQPSGFVQSLISELIIGNAKKSVENPEALSAGWQKDGWVRWLQGLRGNYERRMQTMSRVFEAGKYHISHKNRRYSVASTSSTDFEFVNKTKMYDFEFPMAGMFLWLEVHFERHPLFGKVDPVRFSSALWMLQVKHKVLLAPGTMFGATKEIANEKGWRYFRACFSYADENQLEAISTRFVDAMNAMWEIEDVQKIEELADEVDKEDTTADMEDLLSQGEAIESMNPIVC